MKFKNLEEVQGNLYLGIDAGSTTSKIVVIDEDCNIVYDFYANNQGNPLDLVKEQLSVIYSKLNDNQKLQVVV